MVERTIKTIAMLRTSCVVWSVFLAYTWIVSADFDQFHFSSSATEYLCSDTGFECRPPSICAHESSNGFSYCCEPDNQFCWIYSFKCDGGTETTPSGAQQSCSNGINTFCCLKNTESCTEANNQINTCWNINANPVKNLSDTKMNETFSSLSSENPLSTSFNIALTALQAAAAPTTSLPVPASSSSLSSASASATSTSTTPPSKSKGLSGGAIGGIVGGVLGGLAIIGVIVFVLLRRRKANAHAHAPIAVGPPAEHQYSNRYELNADQQQQAEMTRAPMPTAKYAYHADAPMASPEGGYRDEPEIAVLEGNQVRGQMYEMPESPPMEIHGGASVRRA